VKLNGVRIELEHVEKVILSHPAVTECVVLVQHDARPQSLERQEASLGNPDLNEPKEEDCASLIAVVCVVGGKKRGGCTNEGVPVAIGIKVSVWLEHPHTHTQFIDTLSWI